MSRRNNRGASGSCFRDLRWWARGAAVAAILSLSALLVTACGSSGSDTGGSTTGSGGGTAESGESSTASTSEGASSKACELAAEWQEAPGFVGPGKPTDAAATNGKSVWFIPFTKNNDSVRQVSEGVQAAAAAAGLDYSDFDPKGDVNEMNRGVAQAISQHAEVIVLFAIPPAAVSAEVKKARSQGIKVVDSLNGDPDEALGEVDAHVTFSYSDAGKARAQQAVCATEGELDGLLMTTNELTTTPVMFGAIEEEVENLCPTCKLESQDVPLAEWQERGPQVAKTAVQRNPDLNFLFPGYGDLAFLTLPALLESGAIERGVMMNALNALEVNLEQVVEGNISADVGNPQKWLGWAIIDQSMRLLNGEKPLDENVPIRMFTKENLDGVEDLGNEDELYGGEYEEGYKKLWGV